MIKIKTEVLKDMLNKIIKVYKPNKILPLTYLIELESNENGLSIKITDNVTTMIMNERIEGLPNARTVVDAKIITDLVNKITTEEIELNINENSLSIIGNGVYNLDVRVDESGEVVKLPTIDQELINSANREFDFKGIAERLKICRSAISLGEDGKELGNYYLKDIIIASDGQKLSTINNVPSMKDDELFIGNDFGRIIADLGFVKANYIKKDEKLVIVGENFVLSTTMEISDLENFKISPLPEIRQMISTSYTNNATIKKDNIVKLLDRLNLFVTAYDNNSINLLFLPDKIKATSQKKTCDEDIEYESKDLKDLVEYNSPVNIEFLKQLLSVLPSDTIEFQFDTSIPVLKIVDGEIVQFISILED